MKKGKILFVVYLVCFTAAASYFFFTKDAQTKVTAANPAKHNMLIAGEASPT